MRAINLRTEYLVNPVGIDIQHPRLMWICEEGLKQLQVVDHGGVAKAFPGYPMT